MSRRPSPTSSRRIIPIKRAEGEPLTRSDLQYDFLHSVFSDTHVVFTNPWPNPENPSGNKLTFRNLYIKTLLNSTKATKAFRDKLAESDVFSEDFAMIALLVNVGRINTTMSFFPEMKTTIRSYHPVPALQRTTGNLQDAPRIKHMLKAVTLEDDEANKSPNLPADILSRLSSGRVPPTTVTNLIFVLANHSSTVGLSSLPDDVDFLDLFMRTDLSSACRAKAFLWLCFNYLESPASNNEDDYDDDVIANPFGDPRKHGKPSFIRLTAEEAASENVDPEDELKLTEKLTQYRETLLQSQGKLTLSTSGSVMGDAENTPGLGGEEISAVSKGKRKRENAPTIKNPSHNSTVAGEKKTAAMSKGRRQRLKTTDVPSESNDILASQNRGARQRATNTQNHYPPHQQQRLASNNYQYSTDSDTVPDHRYSPYQSEYVLRRSSDIYQTARARRPVSPRSFLQHAWLKVTTIDPLIDSDDEADEHSRHEYMQRLRVIAGIIGKPFPDSNQPTVQPSVPESAHQQRYM